MVSLIVLMIGTPRCVSTNLFFSSSLIAEFNVEVLIFNFFSRSLFLITPFWVSPFQTNSPFSNVCKIFSWDLPNERITLSGGNGKNSTNVFLFDLILVRTSVDCSTSKAKLLKDVRSIAL